MSKVQYDVMGDMPRNGTIYSAKKHDDDYYALRRVSSNDVREQAPFLLGIVDRQCLPVLPQHCGKGRCPMGQALFVRSPWCTHLHDVFVTFDFIAIHVPTLGDLQVRVPAEEALPGMSNGSGVTNTLNTCLTHFGC